MKFMWITSICQKGVYFVKIANAGGQHKRPEHDKLSREIMFITITLNSYVQYQVRFPKERLINRISSQFSLTEKMYQLRYHISQNFVKLCIRFVKQEKCLVLFGLIIIKNTVVVFHKKQCLFTFEVFLRFCFPG